MENLKKSKISEMDKLKFKNGVIKNNIRNNINDIMKDLRKLKGDIDFEEGEISKILESMFILRNKVGWKLNNVN